MDVFYNRHWWSIIQLWKKDICLSLILWKTLTLANDGHRETLIFTFIPGVIDHNICPTPADAGETSVCQTFPHHFFFIHYYWLYPHLSSLFSVTPHPFLLTNDQVKVVASCNSRTQVKETSTHSKYKELSSSLMDK